MKEKIKELRIKIDGLAQLTKELKPFTGAWAYDAFNADKEPSMVSYNSKEIEKAVDNLYLAKAWLGKLLGELGTETPYKNDGKRKIVKDIEPTADKNINVFRFIKQGDRIIIANITNEEWKLDSKFEISHIEKVDCLREEMRNILEEVNEIYTLKENLFNNWFLVIQHLSEARFWLGFELGRCRNESENKE